MKTIGIPQTTMLQAGKLFKVLRVSGNKGNAHARTLLHTRGSDHSSMRRGNLKNVRNRISDKAKSIFYNTNR